MVKLAYPNQIVLFMRATWVFEAVASHMVELGLGMVKRK